MSQQEQQEQHEQQQQQHQQPQQQRIEAINVVELATAHSSTVKAAYLSTSQNFTNKCAFYLWKLRALCFGVEDDSFGTFDDALKALSTRSPNDRSEMFGMEVKRLAEQRPVAPHGLNAAPWVGTAEFVTCSEGGPY